MEEQQEHRAHEAHNPTSSESMGESHNPGSTGKADPKDVEENKAIAAVGYLGILCLVPLLAKKDSPYAQHHAKQGLVIFIAWVVLSFVNVIPLFGQILWILGSLLLLILVITGVINALNGVMWEAPVLGDFAKQINL